MHACDTLSDVGEDVEDLWLGKAVLQPGVHKIDQATAIAKLHDQKNFIASSLKFRSMRVDICDNRSVAFEALHCFDLGAHAPQSILIGHRNPLQDGLISAIDRLIQLDEVYMGEASLREIFLNDHTATADLNLGAWREGTSWSASRNSYGGGTVRSMMVFVGHDVRRRVLTV